MSRLIVIYIDSENDSANKKKIYAEKEEVTRAEFFQAMQAGLKPSLKVKVRSASYTNEKYLWYQGLRYKIYRIYEKQDERVELFAERM